MPLRRADLASKGAIMNVIKVLLFGCMAITAVPAVNASEIWRFTDPAVGFSCDPSPCPAGLFGDRDQLDLTFTLNSLLPIPPDVYLTFEDFVNSRNGYLTGSMTSIDGTVLPVGLYDPVISYSGVSSYFLEFGYFSSDPQHPWIWVAGGPPEAPWGLYLGDGPNELLVCGGNVTGTDPCASQYIEYYGPGTWTFTKTPEPQSIVIVGLGLTLITFACWKRGRSASAE